MNVVILQIVELGEVLQLGLDSDSNASSIKRSLLAGQSIDEENTRKHYRPCAMDQKLMVTVVTLNLLFTDRPTTLSDRLRIVRISCNRLISYKLCSLFGTILLKHVTNCLYNIVRLTTKDRAVHSRARIPPD